MIEKRYSIQFSAGYTDVFELNNNFSVAKMWVAYHGKNRNMTEIPKDVFVDAIPTMAYCPVVARYDRETNDFGGHDIEVIMKEDYLQIVNSTVPFGVVPENPKWSFETIVDSSGDEHEYLTSSVILWKRQEGYERLIELGSVSQSMEIDVLEGHDSEDGYFVIDKMRFAAFCILGSAHEPCFEGASIKVDPGDAQLKGDHYAAMIAEMKSFNLSIPDQYCYDVASTEENANVENREEEGQSDTDCEPPLNESAPDAGESDAPAEFSMLSEIESALSSAVDGEHKNVWLLDYDDSRIIMSCFHRNDGGWVKQYISLPYKKDDDGKYQFDFEMSEEIQVQYLTAEIVEDQRKQSKLIASLSDYKTRREAEDKRAEIDAVLSKFSVLDDAPEFIELKKEAYSMSRDDVELRCYAIKGIISDSQAVSTLRVPLPNRQGKADIYGGLFEKYSNKN